VLSLGTIYNSPLWLFYSSNEPFDRLSQFKGKRIAVGPAGSGTRSAAEKILAKGGVNSENAVFFPLAGTAAGEALHDGKVMPCGSSARRMEQLFMPCWSILASG
jgi:TRAP-type uncharacterized transport system substrate-binding protein